MKPNNEKEKRRFLRIPFEAVHECKSLRPSAKSSAKMADAAKVLSKNISQSGILINTTEKTSVGDELEIKITVPSMEGYSTVKIAGKIVWVRKLNVKSYDCGIEFTRIKPKDVDIIRDFIAFFPAEEEELEIYSGTS